MLEQTTHHLIDILAEEVAATLTALAGTKENREDGSKMKAYIYFMILSRKSNVFLRCESRRSRYQEG